VKTLYGERVIGIPAGTNNGERIKLAGLGIQKGQNG
jgi:DnaJ-class molecular chaperone